MHRHPHLSHNPAKSMPHFLLEIRDIQKTITSIILLHLVSPTRTLVV
ncbi:hypothetical protein [Rubritalea tangerina]